MFKRITYFSQKYVQLADKQFGFRSKRDTLRQ